MEFLRGQHARGSPPPTNSKTSSRSAKLLGPQVRAPPAYPDSPRAVRRGTTPTAWSAANRTAETGVRSVARQVEGLGATVQTGSARRRGRGWRGLTIALR